MLGKGIEVIDKQGLSHPDRRTDGMDADRGGRKKDSKVRRFERRRESIKGEEGRKTEAFLEVTRRNGQKVRMRRLVQVHTLSIFLLRKKS